MLFIAFKRDEKASSRSKYIHCSFFLFCFNNIANICLCLKSYFYLYLYHSLNRVFYLSSKSPINIEQTKLEHITDYYVLCVFFYILLTGKMIIYNIRMMLFSLKIVKRIFFRWKLREEKEFWWRKKYDIQTDGWRTLLLWYVIIRLEWDWRQSENILIFCYKILNEY